MKKSRIIIPALAMIAFSMVASISGAVAWFTATRTASFDAGSYALVKISSNLSVDLDAGLATSIGTNSTSNKEEVNFSGVLSHGSVNHTNGNAFVSTDGTSATAVDLLSSETQASALSLGTDVATSKTVYAAATFKMTFTLNFGAVQSPDVALYLDAAHTTFTASTDSPEKSGFRVAIIDGASASNDLVIAKEQTSTNCHYVQTASDMPGTGAYSGDLIASDTSVAALPAAGTLSGTQAAARVDYIGTFAYANKDSSNNVTLEFTVACWYEGSDPNIVDKGYVINQSMGVVLAFEAINLAQA